MNLINKIKKAIKDMLIAPELVPVGGDRDFEDFYEKAVAKSMKTPSINAYISDSRTRIISLSNLNSMNTGRGFVQVKYPISFSTEITQGYGFPVLESRDVITGSINLN